MKALKLVFGVQRGVGITYLIWYGWLPVYPWYGVLVLQAMSPQCIQKQRQSVHDAHKVSEVCIITIFSQYIECILVLRSARMHVRHCCLKIDVTN